MVSAIVNMMMKVSIGLDKLIQTPAPTAARLLHLLSSAFAA
jgi:hypothetical protein